MKRDGLRPRVTARRLPRQVGSRGRSALWERLLEAERERDHRPVRPNLRTPARTATQTSARSISGAVAPGPSSGGEVPQPPNVRVAGARGRVTAANVRGLWFAGRVMRGQGATRCRRRVRGARSAAGRLPDAVKSGFHGARTHWIRSFMAFRLGRRTQAVMRGWARGWGGRGGFGLGIGGGRGRRRRR